MFQPDFEFHFFKISTFFTFPDIKSAWCVVRSRFFYWRKELGLGHLWSTLNVFVKSTQNFLETFEKKFHLRKWSWNETQNEVGIFWQNLIFWAETFFQKPLENFLWTLRACSRYLKDPLSLVLCVSKTSVTIRYTNEKISAKNRTRNWYVTTSLGMTVNVGEHAVFMGGSAVFVGGCAVLVG